LIRPIRLTDLPGLKRRQKVVSLDLPESAVRDFSPTRFGARSALGPLRGGADGLLYTSRMRPHAACFYHSPRNGEDIRLVALSTFRDDEAATVAAWERLVERTCLRAAGDGRLRVLARPEEGGECAQLLHKLGFTVATRERVLVRAAKPPSAERQPGFEPLRNDDVWDAWKLYNRTEPVAVQRAEGLTPASWQRGRRAGRRLRQEWILRDDGNAVLHTELLLGRRASALTFHYEPSHRGALPAAVLHAQAMCARRQVDVVYCVVREHQAELEGLLLERGFELARSQVRLVLYTSVLAYAGESYQLAALEKAAAAWRARVSGIYGSGPESGATPGIDWYNCTQR
jgi:hypothetical protein